MKTQAFYSFLIKSLAAVLLAAGLMALPVSARGALWGDASAKEANEAAQPEKASDYTIMVYMCGNTLENVPVEGGDEFHFASYDIGEMASSGFDMGRINILLFAGGTPDWFCEKIADGTSGLYRIVTDDVIVLPGDWGDRNMGNARTLSSFLSYAYQEYPASHYALVLWDHGSGATEGICCDMLADGDVLTLEELGRALMESPFETEKLDWIGFDACLMSTAEVASVVSPYARYMVASEETLPPIGWNYAFLNGLEKDADPFATGQRIIESYFDCFEENNYDAGKYVLSLIDLKKLPAVLDAADSFFGGIALEEDNFPRLSNARRGATSFGRQEDNPDKDWDMVDLASLSEVFREFGDEEARAALQKSIADSVYYRTERENCSGLSVYFPFNSKPRFLIWFGEYKKIGFVPSYTDLISDFGRYLVESEQPSEQPSIWAHAQTEKVREKDTRTHWEMALTEEQEKMIGVARIVALQQGNGGGYHMVASQAADIADGKITGYYVHTNLFVVDEAGTPLYPVPVPYVPKDDGTYAVPLVLITGSGEKVDAQLLCRREADGGALKVTDACIYDEVIQGYSTRLTLPLDMFESAIYRVEDKQWPEEDVLPAFNRWETKETREYEWKLGGGNHLAFVRDALDTDTLYFAFQITDVFNRVYMSLPEQEPFEEGWQVECDDDYVLVTDVSEARPGMVTARLTNRIDREAILGVENVLVNGKETLLKTSVKIQGNGQNGGLSSGESQIMLLRYDLAEGESTEKISFDLVFCDAKSEEEIARKPVHMWHK